MNAIYVGLSLYKKLPYSLSFVIYFHHLLNNSLNNSKQTQLKLRPRLLKLKLGNLRFKARIFYKRRCSITIFESYIFLSYDISSVASETLKGLQHKKLLFFIYLFIYLFVYLFIYFNFCLGGGVKNILAFLFCFVLFFFFER